MPQNMDGRKPGPSTHRPKNRASVSYAKHTPADARAEKRKAKTVKARVELAVQEAERASLLYDASSRQRAKSWMTRLASGCVDDIRSNIFRRGDGPAPYADLIAEFDDVYHSVMSGVEPGLVTLINEQLESGNREKIGPKSVYRGFYEDGPDKLNAVMSDKPIPAELDIKALYRAIDHLVSHVPSQSIRLYDVETVVNTLREPGAEHDPASPGLDGTTNSGLPFCKSGWRPTPEMDVKEARYATLIKKWITSRSKTYFNKLMKGETVEFTAIVGQRIVSRGLDPLHDDKSKRLILALEKPEAVLWKTFTPQTQQALRQVKSPGGVQVHCAWCDAPAVDAAMQLALQVAGDANRKVLSGDVSAFDATVVPKIWELMANGVSDWFFKAKRLFAALNVSDISHVKVLSPLGITGPCASSIKSGSGGTNFIDSLYNILCLYYGEEMGYYDLVNYAVQGDDFIVDARGSLYEAIPVAYRALGLTVNPDKQTYVEGALTYLQRLHVRDMLGGMASAYRTMGSTLVYERMQYEDWNPYMEAIQAISKLENAAFHPAFEALVNFTKDGDKYSLGSSMNSQEVIKQAGRSAPDLLASQARYIMNAGTLDRTGSGFDRAVVNGVLRGETLPPFGSHERFLRVYGDNRIAKAAMLDT